jgi:hypothetical protein
MARPAKATAAEAGAVPQVGVLATRWQPLADDLWCLPVGEPPPREADVGNGGWIGHVWLAREARAELPRAAPGARHARWWLVGTGPSPEFGERLRASIEQRFGARVSDALNTRAAPEAVLGNPAFGDAAIWSLESVAHDMQARCPVCIERLRERIGPAGASLDAGALRLPSRYLRGVSGRLGPWDWELWPRGSAKRRDDTLVLRHRSSGWWLLDGWLWQGALPDLRELDIARFEAGLQGFERRLQQLALRSPTGRAPLMGSQGGRGGLADWQAQQAYVLALRQAVQAAWSRGEPEGAAAAQARHALPARFTPWIEAAPLRHELNWQRMWHAVEQSEI